MEVKESCLSCKVISVGSLLGIGGYLINKSKSQPPVSKYSLFAIGTVIASLGIGEIFDKSPFR